jgi:PAS domain S-box-containing protein
MAAKKSGGTSMRQAETVDELRVRADEFQSIFDNSALGIFQSSIEGRFLRVNPAFAEILGYQSQDDLISSIKDIHSQFYAAPDLRQEIMAAVEAEDGLSRFEADLQRKDGSVITAALNIRAVRDRNGKLTHLDGFIEDVTIAKSREREIKEQAEHLSRENTRLRASIKERYRFGDLIGKSAAMQAVYESISQAAANQVNVIIYGESGTGKELVARAIHNLSRRSEHDFVPVNCGAIPGHLLESEFFGHRRGAFTGAHADTHGYLDIANGGSLFLDEIGELSLEMQVKLLRAIEGGGYFPVGDSRPRHSDFRVIAATNRNLREMVKAGRVREDFFFRIHIIPITLPPLRERREDIPFLVDHFLRQFTGEKTLPALQAGVLEALYKYDWPGNIRELQNVLRRYLAIKRLDFLDAPAETPTAESLPAVEQGQSLNQIMTQFERTVIEKCLEQHRWHRGKTAAALKIDRKTLFIKMKAHGLI